LSDTIPALIGPSRPKGSSEGSRGAGFHPQVVNNLGTTQPTGTWAAHRRKAPRVRRISLLFAEGRVRRPLACSAKAEPAGWDRRRRRALQPVLSRSHDRRCPSGSGWGEAPAVRILRGALHWRRRPPRADGPWPVKARLVSPGSPDGPSRLLAGCEAREACARESERSGPARVRFRRYAPRAGPRGSRLEEPPRWRHLAGVTEGNLRRVGRGSGDRRLCSRAVLVAEIDERRRVHAFGYGSSPYASRTGGQPSGAVLPRAEGLLLRAKG